MSTVPDVSIIIPVLHYCRPLNKKRFFMPRYTIAEVLEDIQKNVKISHEVVVVCNGQEPDLVDLVKTHPAIGKYCLNNLNAGVARSWNMGAQLAEGKALLYLNDDVSVGEGAVEGLWNVLNSAPDVGVVGPRGSNWQGAEHHEFVDATDTVVQAGVVSGFCFMLKSDVLHQLGGFDVNYTPAGFEEIDLSRAAEAHGYRNLVVPKVEFHHYHHHGVSAYSKDIIYFRQSINTKDLHVRNKAHFANKWKIEL